MYTDIDIGPSLCQDDSWPISLHHVTAIYLYWKKATFVQTTLSFFSYKGNARL